MHSKGPVMGADARTLHTVPTRTRLAPRQHVHERRLAGAGDAHERGQHARPEGAADVLQQPQPLLIPSLPLVALRTQCIVAAQLRSSYHADARRHESCFLVPSDLMNFHAV